MRRQLDANMTDEATLAGLAERMPLFFMLALALASFGLILILSNISTTPSKAGELGAHRKAKRFGRFRA